MFMAIGDSPQILLEMFFVYNKVRAGIRTFNPKQLKYEDRSDIKFKQSVLMQNVNRVKAANAAQENKVKRKNKWNNQAIITQSVRLQQNASKTFTTRQFSGLESPGIISRRAGQLDVSSHKLHIYK